MKILFFNSAVPNYVADGLFHGLKLLEGHIVVDQPRMDYMYQDASTEDLQKTGTRGNTLYKLLASSAPSNGLRTMWHFELETYDFIIFSDIFFQCDLFNFIYKTISLSKRKNLCIVDGYDITAIFPFINNNKNLRVRPWVYSYPVNKVRYFKREFENTGQLYGLLKEKFLTVNTLFSRVLKAPPTLLPISMSIPEEHIELVPFSQKKKDFINYNLDPELDELFPKAPVAELGKWQPAFADQTDYFNEIKVSRFGITTKRKGWDCLRHYEYAAKGAILCFKDLELKHERCAPHGLDTDNCIPYSSKEDLIKKIASKSASDLERIQKNQYDWIRQYSTKNVALRFLSELEKLG